MGDRARDSCPQRFAVKSFSSRLATLVLEDALADANAFIANTSFGKVARTGDQLGNIAVLLAAEGTAEGSLHFGLSHSFTVLLLFAPLICLKWFAAVWESSTPPSNTRRLRPLIYRPNGTPAPWHLTCLLVSVFI